MESIRLRLEFKNSDILSNAQKSQGLDKTWILLPKPHINFTTFSDLSAFILQTFHLFHSCPHGLLLSMDGFALPSFVSISILRDNDVISVQKIDHPTVDGSDTFDKVEQQLVAIDFVSTGTLLLSNDKFKKESGGCEIVVLDDESAEKHEENNLEASSPLIDRDDISKRRKASQKLQGSKKKKPRSELCEAAAAGINRESEFIEIPYENEVPSEKKSKSKKGKSSKTGNQTTGDANARHDEENIKVVCNLKINGQFKENGEDDGTTNLSSIKSDQLQNEGPDQLQNEGLDQTKGLLNWKQFGGKDISEAWSGPEEENRNHKTHGNLGRSKPGEENQNHEIHGNSNIEIDTANDVDPIEIRPGHICSESLEEDRGHGHKVQIVKPRYVPRECYNFIQGKCNYGASCRFLHSVTDKTDVGTEANETHGKQCDNIRRDKAVPRECNNFIQGKCIWGSSCRFLHSVPDKTDLGMEGTETYGKQYDNVKRKYVVPDKTERQSSFHNRYYQDITSSSKISNDCREDQSSSLNEHGKYKAVNEVSRNYTLGRCNKESHCRYLHQELSVSVGLRSTTGQFGDTSRYKAVCRYYIRGKCHKGLDCRYLHTEPDLTGSGPTSQAVDTERYMSLPQPQVCRNYSQGRCHKGSDCWFLHPEPVMGVRLESDQSASKAISGLADAGPCNGNGVTSMSFGSNDKCTNFMVNGNGSPNQGYSAQAAPVETGVDLWEQAFNSIKEEVSRGSSWGKITSSNNVNGSMPTSSNRNNSRSHGAFNGRTVRPTLSQRGRGRGRQYGRN